MFTVQIKDFKYIQKDQHTVGYARSCQDLNRTFQDKKEILTRLGLSIGKTEKEALDNMRKIITDYFDTQYTPKNIKDFRIDVLLNEVNNNNILVNVGGVCKTL